MAPTTNPRSSSSALTGRQPTPSQPSDLQPSGPQPTVLQPTAIGPTNPPTDKVEGLLGFPEELLAAIVVQVRGLQQPLPIDARPPPMWHIDGRAMVYHSCPGSAELAALRRTCYLLHRLTYKPLYGRTFNIMVTNSLTPQAVSNVPLRPSVDFLHQVRRLHIELRLTKETPNSPHGPPRWANAQPSVAAELSTLQRIIDALRQSPRLEAIGFHFYSGDLDRSKVANLRSRVDDVRRRSTREAGLVGKNHKDRELDYMQMVCDLLKKMLSEEAEGSEVKFYRLFAER